MYFTTDNPSVIQISLRDNKTTLRNISLDSDFYYSLFVTTTDDIYVAGSNQSQIHKVTSNGTQTISLVDPDVYCFGIFIDIYNNIFCSVMSGHKVMRKSLISNLSNWTVIAGTGSNGSEPDMLWSPHGIFVDFHLTLFVADCYNNRIQSFKFGKLNGTTVVGDGTNDTITLYRPTGVVLDADGWLFITDRYHRIVASGSNGFRCVVGCNDETLTSDQLGLPITMNFDSYGNIFVVDIEYRRIQKFIFETSSCGKFNKM